MNCPNCGQETEAGAAFCGNCGQALTQTPSPIAQVFQNSAGQPPTRLPTASLAAVGASAVSHMPSYAVANPDQHSTELKSLLSLICAVLGLVSVLLVPLLALAFGITAIVLGTMSRHHLHRALSTTGILLGGLAVAAGLAMWVYAASHNASLRKTLSERNNPPVSTTQAVTASTIDTPCYATGFIVSLNISRSTSDSCDMNAYNGSSVSASNNIYKVFSNQANNVTETNFSAVAKQALEKDVQSTLPNFSLDSEQAGLFAGSPAYAINVSDGSHNVAVIEEAVLHKVGAGYNFFVLVHATNGKSTDLAALEAQWQWK
jgi:hypothetical protein